MNNMTKKILSLLLLVAGLLWWAAPAQAQLEVRLEPTSRRDFVAGENVQLKLTIINQTDGTIALTNTPGRCWLHLEIVRQGDNSIVAPSAVPRYPDLTIGPGSRRACQLELKNYFNLNREGVYRARAFLRMPDMTTGYSSNIVTFNITSGGEVNSFQIQARGQRLKVSVRGLKVNNKNVLFGQVKSLDTNTVLGACAMAEYLSFMKPIIKLDRAQNLHLLCQSTPKYYTYAVMNTLGELRTHKILVASGGPVDMVSTGSGIRYIGLAPYVKPKGEKTHYHSANERP